MGLFKGLVNIATAPVSLLSKGITGKSLGSHAEDLLGLSDEEKAAQFNPELRQQMEDVQRIRDKATGEVKDVSEVGKAQKADLKVSTQQALDKLQQRQGGLFVKAQQQQALSGGVSQGGNERLARQQAQSGGLFGQQLRGESLRQEAGITASDLGRQQALKERAMFAVPQLGMGIANIQNQANAANMQAQALADQRKAGKLGAIGSVIGGIGGAMVGGPTGAMVGSQVGGGLFSSMG